MNLDERLRAIELLLETLWRAAVIVFVAMAFMCGWLAVLTLNGAELERIPTPADATSWALTDLVQVREADRPFQRYLWIPPWGNERWLPALNFTVNTSVSHAQTIQLGVPIAQGWMVRYDLRRLAPQPAKLARAIETWDGLAKDDPYLHVPDQNTKLGVAVLAPTIPADQATVLADLSLSVGSVYRADWFIVKALSTLNGGRYYQFRQVDRKPEKSTPLDNWLSQRGLFVATTQAVGGEKRAAMFRSLVTGKPRRIDLFPTLAGGLGSITRDIRDENAETQSHPLRNLLKFADDGSEVIVAQPNGMLDYVLADAAGNIVDEAPPDLVRDHTIPPPFTARLQPARSCISCHSIDGEDGWRAVRNDVQTLLSSRLNVFADLGDLKLSREEAVDKLAGLYALDVEHADGMLGRARRDHSTAVFRCCAGIPFPADKSIVAQVGQLVTSIIHSYDYDAITPERAALEVGYRVPKDWEGDVLESVLGAANPQAEIDPVVGFLRSGVAVNRSDLETVYQDLLNAAEAARRDK